MGRLLHICQYLLNTKNKKHLLEDFQAGGLHILFTKRIHVPTEHNFDNPISNPTCDPILRLFVLDKVKRGFSICEYKICEGKWIKHETTNTKHKWSWSRHDFEFKTSHKEVRVSAKMEDGSLVYSITKDGKILEKFSIS